VLGEIERPPPADRQQRVTMRGQGLEQARRRDERGIALDEIERHVHALEGLAGAGDQRLRQPGAPHQRDPPPTGPRQVNTQPIERAGLDPDQPRHGDRGKPGMHHLRSSPLAARAQQQRTWGRGERPLTPQQTSAARS
jgi:hypothetical protein